MRAVKEREDDYTATTNRIWKQQNTETQRREEAGRGWTKEQGEKGAKDEKNKW